jgi:hypothetical protein
LKHTRSYLDDHPKRTSEIALTVHLFKRCLRKKFIGTAAKGLQGQEIRDWEGERSWPGYIVK